MASISRDAGGRRRIQFLHPEDGSRKAIRLGKIPQRAAEAVKLRIEHLIAARISGSAVDDETARWVADLDDTLHDKLVRVGLVQSRQKADPAALGPFLEAYISGRTDLKPLTIRHLNDARRKLVEFFGADKPLREITPGDADDWRLWLRERLGENTIRRKCGRAKQFFRAALRKRLIDENPFADMKDCAVRANKSREFFVSRDAIEAVIAACPDNEWKLIVALARYGGLRIPSELCALRWGDIDWERGRFRVTSVKTEHHEGHGERWVPLFPELRCHLEAVFDEAPEGAEFVVSRYRDKETNLRTQFQRIIRRSGLKAWPKLFQNLRSTRETELAGQFPIHVVCDWLGNSAAIAARHYLQVTDEHYEAAQNPAQYTAAYIRNSSQADSEQNAETPVLQGFAETCEAVQCTEMPPLGLEPRTY